MRERLQPIQILLIEDSIGDIRLTEEVFKESNLKINLSIVMDGVEAMAFLRQEGEYTNALRPDFILLDLNLPKKDGRQVLKEIKEDPTLAAIPIAVLSLLSAEEDILQAYKMYANCYITKPLDIEQYIEAIKTIENFWFKTVTLPPRIE
ncbi:two-component response regulator [Legionella busanensis]|uniref:Two-component response regulator n=1 Tax=Legionella busanensis TaxID=190655 RepID=A0A378JLW3_9GAMM|nr:response regulator [Legionella busanensis]STX52316.1 two-component response regulator [Legionella busanensis]